MVLFETMQDHVGLQGTEDFQTVADQRRAGMQRQGKSSQETIMQPWEIVLVAPSRETLNNPSELFCRTKPPMRRRLRPE